MKSAIVSNIQIQFDLVIGNGSIEDVYKYLHEINSTLQREFPMEQPQVFVGAIRDEDIEIANDENDEPAESIWSEIRDNFEDDGILHIDAWTTEDENDEDGRTIAKINLSTGEVEYLDERAKTDADAQETIQWHIENIRDENQKALDKMRDENWD